MIDQGQWSRQRQELTQGSVSDQHFLSFFEFWLDAADKLLAEGLDTQRCNGLPANPTSISSAASKAFQLAEQTFFPCSVDWIGGMLMLATQFWVHGEALDAGLSFWERRIMDEAYARKLLDLQQSARMPIEDSK